MQAVITADIVDSSSLSSDQTDIVLNAIHSLLDDYKNVRVNIEDKFIISRGDSIQIELDSAAQALNIAMLLKATVNKISFREVKRQSPVVDVRIAIGIGDIESKRELVNESSGSAYINSGRMLDSMKKEKRLFSIKTNNSFWDEEFDAEFKMLEVILSGWKITSAEVVYLLLLNYKEKEIQEKLKISQSAVNQRKKAAGWNGIDALLKRFEKLISKEEQI
jgi:hypothetical protein